MSKINLSNYKSSGVYFIETDNSIIDVVETSSMRLVPGFSEHGPFNKPIVLTKPADRKKIFGDGVNTKLERNGCFFERTLDILLEDGDPVIALNLLNVTKDDKVGHCSLHTGYDKTADVEDTLFSYAEFFDRRRFWAPSSENLLRVAASGLAVELASAPIFNIVNIGTSDVTVFAIKDVNVTGYNVTLENWYAGEELPYSWMHKSDFVADYFIRLVAIKGNWSEYKKLAVDLTWGAYFDNNGLKAERVAEFLANDAVSVVGNWSGCIIPNFYNKAGNLISIEPIVNSYTTETGIMIAINEYAMQEYKDTPDYVIDLVGHNIKSDDSSVKILSYTTVDAGNVIKSCGIKSEFNSGKVDASCNENEFIIGYLNGEYLPKINDLVEFDGGLTRIVKKQYLGYNYKNINDTTQGFDTNGAVYYKFTCLEPIDKTDNTVTIHTSLADVLTHIEPTCLTGLKITNKHRPGYDKNGNVSLDGGVSKIYEMLEDEGIKRGLIDPEMISFRYIIDSMAGGLGTGLQGKQILAELAKKRGKCTAIINFPSVAQMNMSTDPIFTTAADADSISKRFSTDYIPTGGNLDYLCSNPLTMPTKDEGADYCGVFSPFLKYRDGARTILIPPAAHVARAYNKKYAAGADQYMTVANRNGILNDSKIVGLEYQYDQQDRDNLEPFGVNPIIKQGNDIMIYGDRTAYQTVLSDLNYLHIRELLNTIELECYDVLKGYVFQKNNEVTRAEIIRRLTPLFEAKVASGALYTYSIKMDTDNNTEEIINRSFALIDIEVQCTKNMEKIVTQIKIQKYTA